MKNEVHKGFEQGPAGGTSLSLAISLLTLIGTEMLFYRDIKYFPHLLGLQRTLNIIHLIKQKNQQACGVFDIVLNLL